MSWLVNGIVAADTFELDLEDVFADTYPEPHPGVREQFEAAVKAARALVESGTVGVEPFHVSLQGYATQADELSTSNSVSVGVIGQHKPAEG